jgi:diguanylate cyclase (GGDEF)-like protein
MRVLLIDDDPEIREMTRMVLELRGHEIHEAADGPLGLKAAAEWKPDVILLDMMMPGMDGADTLRALRESPATARIPVICVTASVGGPEADRLRALRPAGLIAKPFDPTALEAHLDRAMGSARAEAASRVAPKPGTDSEFERMRQNFVRRSLEQIEQGERLLQTLAGSTDLERLLELMRIFHRFAGISASFGVPKAGPLGKQGETAALALSRRKAAPTAEDVENWRRLLADIRRLLDAPREDTSATTLPPRTETPGTVLVVDADPEVRALVVEQLANEGLLAKEAGSQAEALEAIAAAMPDAIVADVVLPDAQGCGLVEAVRAMPDGAELPIVVLSPHTAFEDKVEAIHCGADALFEKPVDWKSLLRRLQLLMERSEPMPYRVLSVEDDADHAAFIRSVLEAAGHDVQVLGDPTRFEESLQEFNPDIVLMDVILPGASGYDLVRFLRQDERYVTVPAVFLTTEGQAISRFRSARAGGDEHLVKPVSPPLLLATIAARVERARFLKSLMERDGLTRLLNHTAFAERAHTVHAQYDRDASRQCAWVMVDVDHFKAVNDTYGHPVGDRVLAALSALLRRRLRQTDTIGRYGGEEFAVLFEGLPEAEVGRLMDRVRLEFGTIEHGGGDKGGFHCTFSAGVAMLEPGMSLDAWRKASDDALYAAKHGGRNRVVTASSMREVAAEPASASAARRAG